MTKIPLIVMNAGYAQASIDGGVNYYPFDADADIFMDSKLAVGTAELVTAGGTTRYVLKPGSMAVFNSAGKFLKAATAAAVYTSHKFVYVQYGTDRGNKTYQISTDALLTVQPYVALTRATCAFTVANILAACPKIYPSQNVGILIREIDDRIPEGNWISWSKTYQLAAATSAGTTTTEANAITPIINEINADVKCPVTAASNGTTVTLTAKAYGKRYSFGFINTASTNAAGDTIPTNVWGSITDSKRTITQAVTGKGTTSKDVMELWKQGEASNGRNYPDADYPNYGIEAPFTVGDLCVFNILSLETYTEQFSAIGKSTKNPIELKIALQATIANVGAATATPSTDTNLMDNLFGYIAARGSVGGSIS